MAGLRYEVLWGGVGAGGVPAGLRGGVGVGSVGSGARGSEEQGQDKDRVKRAVRGQTSLGAVDCCGLNWSDCQAHWSCERHGQCQSLGPCTLRPAERNVSSRHY